MAGKAAQQPGVEARMRDFEGHQLFHRMQPDGQGRIDRLDRFLKRNGQRARFFDGANHKGHRLEKERLRNLLIGHIKTGRRRRFQIILPHVAHHPDDFRP